MHGWPYGKKIHLYCNSAETYATQIETSETLIFTHSIFNHNHILKDIVGRS
jgi:hypothetical protein